MATQKEMLDMIEDFVVDMESLHTNIRNYALLERAERILASPKTIDWADAEAQCAAWNDPVSNSTCVQPNFVTLDVRLAIGLDFGIVGSLEGYQGHGCVTDKRTGSITHRGFWPSSDPRALHIATLRFREKFGWMPSTCAEWIDEDSTFRCGFGKLNKVEVIRHKDATFGAAWAMCLWLERYTPKRYGRKEGKPR